MQDKAQISLGNLWALGVINTLSGVILLLPTVSVEAGGRAAWMVAVVAGVNGFVMLLIVGKLAQRFPNKTFPTYVGEILGKWPGKVVSLALATLAGVNCSVDIGVAAKNLEGIYFVNTPPWVVAAILAVMALSISWFGLVHASRLAPGLLFLLFITFLFTFPLLWRWMKPGYLIPLFDPSPIDVTSKAFWVAVGVLRPAYLPLVIVPYVKEPTKAIRVLGYAHWVGWLGNLLAVVTPVLVFSPEGARAVSQPFPYVIAVLRIANFPFERLEMLGRLAFHINTVFGIAFVYFTGGLVFAEVFHTKLVRPFMLLSALLSLAPLMLVPSAIHSTDFSYDSVIRGLMVAVATFTALWIVYWLRGLHRRKPAAAG